MLNQSSPNYKIVYSSLEQLELPRKVLGQVMKVTRDVIVAHIQDIDCSDREYKEVLIEVSGLSLFRQGLIERLGYNDGFIRHYINTHNLLESAQKFDDAGNIVQ